MPPLPFSGLRVCSLIEPLEARIAPATIFIGDARETVPPGGDTPVDTEYRELNVTEFQQKLFTDTSSSTDAISVAVDSPATNNTFFLRLSAGDQVRAFTNASSYRELITVFEGSAVAFFVDYNENNNYDSGEFTGLALGKDARLNVAGNVRGDIVTNLDEKGTATSTDDTLDMSGLVSRAQGIERVTVTGGSIFGDVVTDPITNEQVVQYAKVLSGGSINSLLINGTVGSVLAGSAADGEAFDFFPDRTDLNNTPNNPADDIVQPQPGGGGIVTFSLSPGQKGASITNTTVDGLADRLEAGAAGAGAKGGNVNGVRITSDTDGFSILAGAGGPSDPGAAKLKGGAGGNVSNVIIAGLVDESPNSAVGDTSTSQNGIVVVAGAGGDAASSGVGGKGGGAARIFVGFEVNNGNTINSGDLLQDSVRISAGDGGDGRIGAKGGSIGSVKVRVQTADVVGEEEISISAGDGGNNLAAGRKAGAGAGGSLRGLALQNQVLTVDSDILVSAGDGGLTSGTSKGANGGSIRDTTLLGSDVRVLAGDGSAGTTGGNGGRIKDLQLTRDDDILTRNATIDAGRGGNSTAGKAGKGGNLENIRSLSIDLATFALNSGTQGDGGTSSGGKGGAGGKVSGVSLFDTDTGANARGTLFASAGSGGAGSAGGGKGGSFTNANITTINANIAVTGGNGGNSTGDGKGGKGGGVTSGQFTAAGSVPDPSIPFQTLLVSGTVSAGVGGSSNGAGGAGGMAKLVNMNVEGDGSLFGGNGGAGQAGAAGKGGSIITSGVFARGASELDPDAPQVSDGVLRAGDAGATGSEGASGGSILGKAVGAGSKPGGNLAALRAATTLTVEAGDGSNGGSGGSIKKFAYGSAATALTPTPSGNIVIQAGNGSDGPTSAGRGGSIVNVFGAVSSGPGSTTTFRAGDGGGSAQRSGAGGSLGGILLTLGGGPDVLLTMQAGDAGDSSSAAKGGKGGNVLNVGVIDLDPATNFRSIAAGNGGDAGAVGGRGGSLKNLFIQDHDIGVRTGEEFGYSTMGGLFAGLGGDAARDGVNGSVSGVTANAIASIVAGRAEQGGPPPQLVRRVDHIILNDDNLLLERNGAFLPDGSFNPAYYAIANLVGAIVNITTPDARFFHFNELNGQPGFQVGDMPIDGILMAEVLDQKTINFIPEARLTLNPEDGTQEFFDNDNKV